MNGRFFNRFEAVCILDGLRTPMVDCQGACADANPIDLGIEAARSVLARSGVDPKDVDSVISGYTAPGGFDQFCVARHIGLYAGVRLTVTVARQLKAMGARWGIASACVGGGQGIALLIENTEFN